MSSPYYNRRGEPITAAQWAALQDEKRVAETTVGPLWVSTVWLGLNHNWDDSGPPLIFETMIFDAAPVEHLHPELRGLVEDCWRYSTEQEALAGHDKVCVDLRVLLSNIEMAEQVQRDAEVQA